MPEGTSRAPERRAPPAWGRSGASPRAVVSSTSPGRPVHLERTLSERPAQTEAEVLARLPPVESSVPVPFALAVAGRPRRELAERPPAFDDVVRRAASAVGANAVHRAPAPRGSRAGEGPARRWRGSRRRRGSRASMLARMLHRSPACKRRRSTILPFDPFDPFAPSTWNLLRCFHACGGAKVTDLPRFHGAWTPRSERFEEFSGKRQATKIGEVCASGSEALDIVSSSTSLSGASSRAESQISRASSWRPSAHSTSPRWAATTGSGSPSYERRRCSAAPPRGAPVGRGTQPMLSTMWYSSGLESEGPLHERERFLVAIGTVREGVSKRVQGLRRDSGRGR